MYKLIIKSAETGTVLLSGASDEENITEYAKKWVKENGLTAEKVIIDINILKVKKIKKDYSKKINDPQIGKE